MAQRRYLKKGLARFWDTNRSYYEHAMAKNPAPAPERRYLFAYLEGGERVLDLGAGACDNALWLPTGCRYIGMDVSTIGFAMAREAGRPGSFLRSDGSSIPLATASVDAVISTWAIEHFHDPAGTLAEATRVLAPGGLLLLVGSSWDLPYGLPPSIHPRRRLEVTLRRMGRQLRALVTGAHLFDVVREPRALSEEFVPDADAVHITQSFFVRRFLEACGLTIVEHRSLPHHSQTSTLQRAWRAVAANLPPWRGGWGNLLIVARRGETARQPPYRLLEL